ncbi:RNA polymerase-binding transcription factor DksA [hydrothermal vent metagenome]|uniref:RNA polymerase-binding transcription factor DksA n=1 Tax=hydrothermal vent metagenome TaxID=652676 RepID=A0A3B1AZQ8_9ZZZZ
MPTKKKTVAKKKTSASKKEPAAKKTAAKKATSKKSVSKKTTAKTGAASKKKITRKKPVTANSDTKSFEPYKMVKGEEYMNDAHVAHFDGLLLDWKHELMEEVDRTVHHMQDEAANFPDPNDRATQESEFTIELRTRDRERKLIKKIDEALDHLDSGDYGYCEQCGMEIGIRRLEARPTANLCIDCKSLDEIRERQRG